MKDTARDISISGDPVCPFSLLPTCISCGNEIQAQPIPVALRSKALVCGHSLAGIVGSNPAEGMDVCLL